MMKPTNSRGWPAIAVASLPAPPNATFFLREDRLGTFLHLNVCGYSPTTLGDKFYEIVCAVPARAFERQPDRHPRPLADPALDTGVRKLTVPSHVFAEQTRP